MSSHDSELRPTEAALSTSLLTSAMLSWVDRTLPASIRSDEQALETARLTACGAWLCVGLTLVAAISRTIPGASHTQSVAVVCVESGLCPPGAGDSGESSSECWCPRAALCGGGVDVVGDGSEALRRARTDDFDCVLLDVDLPSLDGRSIARSLRDGGYDRPIIVVTASVLSEDWQASIDARADEHLTKPLRRGELAQALADAAARMAA